MRLATSLSRWQGLLALMLTLQVNADTAPDQLLELQAGPSFEPVGEARLTYPKAAASRGIEGWVMVNFSILPDGSVSDARVQESSWPALFDSHSLSFVDSLVYEPFEPIPGRDEGHPVSQIFMYTFRDNQDELSVAFARRARIINRAMARGDLDKARKKLAKLDDMNIRYLAEQAYADYLWAVYERRRGDWDASRLKIKDALRFADRAVSKVSYQAMLHLAITLEAHAGNHALVVQHVDKLAAIGRPLGEDDPMQVIVNTSRDRLASREPLPTQMKLAPCEYCTDSERFSDWWQLSRPRFALSGAEGMPEVAWLRCGTASVKVPLEANRVYRLPEVEAPCRVTFYADRPLQFTLTEYAEQGAVNVATASLSSLR